MKFFRMKDLLIEKTIYNSNLSSRQLFLKAYNSTKPLQFDNKTSFLCMQQFKCNGLRKI